MDARFHGSFPALITPFRDGKVDEAAFRKLIEWHIAEGTHGIVPVGTTGESPTLSHDEHKRVVEIAVETAAGRIPVIAGAGSNSTAEAVDFAVHANEAGADAALSVVPYYNRPTQEGLYEHFAAVARAVPELPVFVYNVPGRTVAEISVETLARLDRDFANIVGTKDATADLARPSLQRLASGDTFIQLSGEDGTALAFNAHGGTGCISVTANVAPRLCAEFQEATLAGDYAKALTIQDRLMPLHSALFCETSPSPVKYAVSLLGHALEDARLPILPATEGARQQVKAAMVHAGLLN
ncbi:MAG: 4-hydroxy-tetrahydrodipicolinate synthase [Anderseniella sp.]